jgi:biotin transport system permease protein
VGLFFITDLAAQLVIFGAVLALYILPGRVFLTAGLRYLRGFWLFVLIVGIYHTAVGEVVEGAVIVLRLLSAIALANLVTLTTRLTDMIKVVRFLAKPFTVFGLSSKVLELSIALVIRLTPVLVEKGALLSQSWRARSTRRTSWRIILPFTILALDDADHVAEALRARGGLTPLKDT